MLMENRKINLYFVLKTSPENKNKTSDMCEAFQIAVEWSLEPKWITENECLSIDANQKGNVFVFEKFEGDFFKNFLVSHKNSRVVGPKCLLTCFAEQISIPNTQYPVHSMTMKGLLISASAKPAELKKSIKELVGFMGGNYTDVLTTSTTHLVVSAVFSEKYFKANEEGIPVMKYEWIKDMWTKSLSGLVNAVDDDIISTYKCPIFYNLVVTASLLGEKEKQRIKAIINDNGGTYSSDLQLKVTNLLIIPNGRGEKYKFAGRWNVLCLSPAWLDKCLEKKYAVRYENFIVPPENKCSTPVASDSKTKAVTLLDANDTEISVIPSNCGTTVVGETANFDSPMISQPIKDKKDEQIFKTPVKTHTKVDSRQNYTDNARSYETILDNIKLMNKNKYDHLLDGCKIFTCGFSPTEEEKLKRILKYGGAIRFTELNECVTHVILGNPNTSELQMVKSNPNKPHVVRLQWLWNSIMDGRLEKESKYLYFNDDKELEYPSTSKDVQQPSPLSKKGIQILNPEKHIPVSTHPIIGVDQILIEKYSQTRNPELVLQPESTISQSSADPVPLPNENSSNGRGNNYFFGLKFSIIGHNAQSTKDLRSVIMEFGGEVVSNSDAIVDYTIVPFASTTLRIIKNEAVTSFWIEECLATEAIVEVKYYHRPVMPYEITGQLPLTGYVITFSGFNAQEKQYLENLGSFLGAKCQDVLSKKQNDEKGIWRTTHLICYRPHGIKYTTAKKWNLAVTKENWLLQCFKQATMLPVENFILSEDTDIHDGPIASTSNLKNCINKATKDITNFDFPNAPSSNNISTKKGNSQLTNASYGIDEKLEKIERPRMTAPSITEAVYRSVNRNAETDERSLRPDKTNNANWPTGLLLQFNANASSNVKRKSDSDYSNSKRSYRSGSPRKKLRYEEHISSSYEEVGWQDTLTDIENAENEKEGNSDGRKDQPGITIKATQHTKPIGETSNKNIIIQSNPEETTNPINPIIPKTDEVTRKNLRKNLPASRQNENIENVRESHETAVKDRDYTKQNDSGETSAVQLHWNRDKNKLTKRNYPVQPKSKANAKEATRVIFRKNFLISGQDIDRKSHFENVIRSLGGRVLPSFTVDCVESEKVTHFICDEMKKTEKMLCSIASGVWVLHSSYIEKCSEKNTFVAEEEFEWGNPINERFLKNTTKDSQLIARAAHRWRITIQNGGPKMKPFIDMKAVIITTPGDESVNSLARVVKSGDGKVFPVTDLLNATHCLMKGIHPQKYLPVPLQRLAEKKIHCVHAVYLSDYLMTDPPPNVANCYLDIYKRLL